MTCICRLWEIEPQQECVVAVNKGNSALHMRLQELGFVEGTKVRCVGRSPGGDPCAYALRGTVMAIRRQDADQILVRREEKQC